MDLLDLFDQAATQAVLDLKDPEARDYITLKRDINRLIIPRLREYAQKDKSDQASMRLSSLVAALGSGIALAASAFPSTKRAELLATMFRAAAYEAASLERGFADALAMLQQGD